MQEDTAEYLLKLNRQFYRDFAAQFSSTRQRLQPGVKRIIAQLPRNASILDLGCGNGELFIHLANTGFHGKYVGVDFSAQLVRIAKNRWNNLIKNQYNFSKQPHEKFLQEGELNRLDPIYIEIDITGSDWYADLPMRKFDIVCLFAVLHHIPGQRLRSKIISDISELLVPGAKLYHSEWQFLKSSRLRSRIKSWDTVGLSQGMLDRDDYLLDWRHEGYGLRYVHHFSLQELENLAVNNNFSIEDTFFSDGKGGELGLYQTWRKDVISNNEPG